MKLQNTLTAGSLFLVFLSFPLHSEKQWPGFVDGPYSIHGFEMRAQPNSGTIDGEMEFFINGEWRNERDPITLSARGNVRSGMQPCEAAAKAVNDHGAPSLFDGVVY